jgi:aminotransferase
LYRLYGLLYDPEREIVITTGVSEGIDLACRVLLNPGDEVIGHDPSFVAYQPLVTMTGARFIPVPTRASDGFQLTAAEVHALVTAQTRALILNYPCNPTGAVLTEQEAEAIAAIAKRNDLLVISDEIYDRLVYGVPHVCFAAIPGMKERTVLLGGFSKAYAMTGWRVGYAAAPAPILEGMLKVHQYAMMSAPTPGQHAALAALRLGEPYVQEMVAEYDVRRRFLLRGLREIGLDTFEARGAFYVFPNVRSSGLDDEVFMERLLLEEQVVVVPGSAFGAEGRDHVRLCYAASQPKIEEALNRIGRFVARLRG